MSPDQEIAIAGEITSTIDDLGEATAMAFIVASSLNDKRSRWSRSSSLVPSAGAPRLASLALERNGEAIAQDPDRVVPDPERLGS